MFYDAQCYYFRNEFFRLGAITLLTAKNLFYTYRKINRKIFFSNKDHSYLPSMAIKILNHYGKLKSPTHFKRNIELGDIVTQQNMWKSSFKSMSISPCKANHFNIILFSFFFHFILFRLGLGYWTPQSTQLLRNVTKYSYSHSHIHTHVFTHKQTSVH